jgi:hypothetical protein
MACPKSKHFHLICRDVFEKENFEKVVEVADPNSALEIAILGLPASWEGAIEVRDATTLSERKFSLIDFWRTPRS